MADDLGVETNIMNIAVSITALFSGIFIVVFGNLADRWGRVLTVKLGFYCSIIGSLLVGLAPSNNFAESFLMAGRIFQGLSGEIGRASCRERVEKADVAGGIKRK